MTVKYIAIIQARLGSTRFPNKVMETVGGIPMVKRVWEAAKKSLANKVIVAWPERYPDLDENDVLSRFKRIVSEFPHHYIIRLTADCPLLTTKDINEAIHTHQQNLHTGKEYYSNHLDGLDVQIFSYFQLHCPEFTHKEHVIADFTTVRNFDIPYRSVDTRADLEFVRKLYAR